MTLSAKHAKKHFTINVQKRPGSDFVYGYCIGGWILLKSLLIFFLDAIIVIITADMTEFH